MNPRGTSGSGKTELVRRVLREYGWQRGGRHCGASTIDAIYEAGRNRPIGYRLAHPRGGNPLIVLGHYEVTSGGCDTIRVADGGTQGIIRRAQEYASSGYDVVMEGLRLSSEVERSAKLAQSHGLHILRLSTPFDDCVRNLIARRRARRDTWTSIERSTAIEHRKVEDACEHLRAQASVEVLCFDEAFARAMELLTVRN